MPIDQQRLLDLKRQRGMAAGFGAKERVKALDVEIAKIREEAAKAEAKEAKAEAKAEAEAEAEAEPSVEAAIEPPEVETADRRRPRSKG